MRNKAGRGGIGLFAYAIFYLAFLYVPVLFLPLFSFNNSVFIAFPLSGFTAQWYSQMLSDSAMLQALRNSLVVGAIAALMSTMLALPTARALTRYHVPAGATILGVVNLSLFIPEIVLGISLLILLNTADVPRSLATIILGHIVVCVPFAVTVLMSRFDGFDKSLEEASLDLGETGWMTFWRVTFPLVLPGIISSLLLSFMVSFDDFMIAFFLSGDQATLPIYIWGQMRFPYKLPTVLALGALILIASAVLVVIGEWVRSYGVRDRHKMVGA